MKLPCFVAESLEAHNDMRLGAKRLAFSLSAVSLGPQRWSTVPSCSNCSDPVLGDKLHQGC